MLCRELIDNNGFDPNVPLYYEINDDLRIQFGREEFCLVTGLRFGVENRGDCENSDSPMPFRRRVFRSPYDSRHITGHDILKVLGGKEFNDLDDQDAVGLCCLAILQLVLLGVEPKYPVDDWLLRLANNRVAWDSYPWGSLVWPHLYKALRKLNVKRSRKVRPWREFYAVDRSDPTQMVAYSLMGYTWAFKTWILESFRPTAHTYFEREDLYPRVVAWTKRGSKFTADKVIQFFRASLPAVRLTPDSIEANSDWWKSSKAYFDGLPHAIQPVPYDYGNQNMHEVPWKDYREYQENNQQQFTKLWDEIRKINNQANFVDSSKTPEHGNMPHNAQTPHESSIPMWQTERMSRGRTPQNLHVPIPSQPGSSGWKKQMAQEGAYWIPDSGGKRDSYVSFGRNPPPVEEELPKKPEKNRKTKGKQVDDSWLPLSLGGAYQNQGVEEVTFLQSLMSENVVYHENADPKKVRTIHYETVDEFIKNPCPVYLSCCMKGIEVPVHFWQDLVPMYCTSNIERFDTPLGWYSAEHINAWMELIILDRPEHANWTVGYVGTTSVYIKSKKFMLPRDPFIIRTLDGSNPAYPSWDEIEIVFLPMHIVGNHWVTGALDLSKSIFYVFDSMESPLHKACCEDLIKRWTPVVNDVLINRGCMPATRQNKCFQVSYNNKSVGISVPRQTNETDCGPITCWLIYCLAKSISTIVNEDVGSYFNRFRVNMCRDLYKYRCEDTRDCGY